MKNESVKSINILQILESLVSINDVIFLIFRDDVENFYIDLSWEMGLGIKILLVLLIIPGGQMRDCRE